MVRLFHKLALDVNRIWSIPISNNILGGSGDFMIDISMKNSIWFFHQSRNFPYTTYMWDS